MQGVYNDPHHSLSIVRATDRYHHVAFYLQDRNLAEEINSPSTIAYLQPSRSRGNIGCDSSRDDEEEDGDARNMLIRSPPRLLRKRRMTRSYEKEQKKRNMPSVDEIRKKYGARKSTRLNPKDASEFSLSKLSKLKAKFVSNTTQDYKLVVSNRLFLRPRMMVRSIYMTWSERDFGTTLFIQNSSTSSAKVNF